MKKLIVIAAVAALVLVPAAAFAKQHSNRTAAPLDVAPGAVVVTGNPCTAPDGSFAFQFVGGTPDSTMPWTLTGTIDDAGTHAGSFQLDANGDSATYEVLCEKVGTDVLSTNGSDVVINSVSP